MSTFNHSRLVGLRAGPPEASDARVEPSELGCRDKGKKGQWTVQCLGVAFGHLRAHLRNDSLLPWWMVFVCVWEYCGLTLPMRWCEFGRDRRVDDSTRFGSEGYISGWLFRSVIWVTQGSTQLCSMIHRFYFPCQGWRYLDDNRMGEAFLLPQSRDGTKAQPCVRRYETHRGGCSPPDTHGVCMHWSPPAALRSANKGVLVHAS